MLYSYNFMVAFTLPVKLKQQASAFQFLVKLQSI